MSTTFSEVDIYGQYSDSVFDAIESLRDENFREIFNAHGINWLIYSIEIEDLPCFIALRMVTEEPPAFHIGSVSSSMAGVKRELLGQQNLPN